MQRAIKFKTIKVSKKGQIAIPSDIRKDMGISEGDELLLVKKGKRIMLEKASELSEKLEDEFDDLLALSEASLRKIWDNREDDIWKQYLRRKR
ncbi:MAG: AbrB/MazE/SpoVT family DNA-binding domain-containing protein [Nitrososphaerales archaeon]